MHEWARRWSEHDVDQLVALFTDDVVYEDVTLGAGNRGKQQLRAFVRGFFVGFPDAVFELTTSFVAGDRGVGEWVVRATHRGDLLGLRATGKTINVRGATVVELADGKIRRNSDYWDMATALRQIGLMPAT